MEIGDVFYRAVVWTEPEARVGFVDYHVVEVASDHVVFEFSNFKIRTTYDFEDIEQQFGRSEAEAVEKSMQICRDKIQRCEAELKQYKNWVEKNLK